PVDHFNTSNTDTYLNRFFINDTYYKMGGPVIVFDFGESGISPLAAAWFLADYNGTKSVATSLAAELNGVVVGWEHRYYGYSRPVPLNDTSGLPLADAPGYMYLTVEQALEDVVYFANNFNQTTLGENRVLNSTTNLGPYQTPWIFVGGSYPGARAVWIRLTHPEIIYASWASSGPMETRSDGSIYFDPITRALPKNCTNDIEAVVKYVDQVIQSGSQTELEAIQIAGYFVENPDALANDTYQKSFSVTPFFIGGALSSALSFSKGNDSSNNNSSSNNNNSNNGAAVAFYAYAYGLFQANAVFANFRETLPQDMTFTDEVDAVSWKWQSLTQVGYFQGSNTSDSYTVLSEYYNVSAVRAEEIIASTFADFPQSSIPPTINNSWLQSLGGWNVQASNVMFTNGEFDPWRAFGVASQAEDVGAPNRAITQDVPACNQVSNGTDVFGLVYPGAVHAEDMLTPTYDRGARNSSEPREDGVGLFVKAWNVWSPCFGQS
ncbi:hypothetical protein P175DRAFT_0401593, partial [Aspergillus ochraceoroseus IBT 24754]